MNDLEEERKAFEDQWKILGGHLTYVVWTTNKMYSLSSSANVLKEDDQISLFNTINTAWGLWAVQAKAKQAKLNELKEKLAKLESGDFVIVPKEPTQNMMINALAVIATGIGKDHIDIEISKCWEKMIEAAQEPIHD